MRGPTTTQLHQIGQQLEDATDIVLCPDGSWKPFSGGRMPAGAAKVPVLGGLPKGLVTAAAEPASARIGTARSRSNGRRTTARARSRTG